MVRVLDCLNQGRCLGCRAKLIAALLVPLSHNLPAGSKFRLRVFLRPQGVGKTSQPNKLSEIMGKNVLDELSTRYCLRLIRLGDDRFQH